MARPHSHSMLSSLKADRGAHRAIHFFELTSRILSKKYVGYFVDRPRLKAGVLGA